MDGMHAVLAALSLGLTVGTPLPPPREQIGAGGTLQLLTPGDPMVLPGQADGRSFGVGRQLASDGRIAAFQSEAGNLAGFDFKVRIGGVVASAGEGVIRRLDAVPEQTVTIAELRTPVVSRDGSTVVYTIYVETFSRLYSDVYLVDLDGGTRTRVTQAPTSPQGMGWSLNPSVSADGRLVAFDSLDALVPEDTGRHDVFVWARQGRTFSMISRAPDGTAANGDSWNASMSNDGNRVAFMSTATNLVPGGSAGGSSQVFLHDRSTGVTRLVSRTPSGGAGNAASSNPAVSPDGRFVAFLSNASDLAPGDDNVRADAYLFDSENGSVSRVSIAAGEIQPNAAVESVSLCDGARRIVFGSAASNLDPMAGGNARKVFLRDTSTTQVRALGRPVDGGAVDGFFGFGILAPDCSSVVYPTDAARLGPPDENQLYDVFREDLDEGGIVMLSRWSGAPPPTSILGAATASNASISSDGQRILVDYVARNMLPGDDGARPRSVLIDRGTGTRTRIDGPIVLGSERPRRTSAIASDAPVSAYVTRLSEDLPFSEPIYVRGPMLLGEAVVTPPGVPEPGFSATPPKISADGTRVLFGSTAGLTQSGRQRLYLSTVGSGVVEGLCPPPSECWGRSASLAAGGEFAAYLSQVPWVEEDGDFTQEDAYRVDLRSRQHALVTPELPDGARLFDTAISGNGRMVAFITDAPSAGPQFPDCPGAVRRQRVLVRDMQNGTVRCGSVNAADPALPASEYAAKAVSISPNGRWLAYLADSLEIVINRIFVTDLETGTTYVANRSAGVSERLGSSSAPAVSDHGQVVFWTWMPLVPDDVARSTHDAYLFEPGIDRMFANGFETP